MEDNKGKIAMGNIKIDEKRKEIIRKLTNRLREIDEMYETEDLIKDNKILFNYREQEYRIRKPTRQEKKEMGEKRIQKFNQLLQEVDEKEKPKYILREQLIDIYEKRDISFEKMNQKLIELNHKHDDKLLKLAQTDNEKRVKELKNEIREIREEQAEISTRKADLLEYSLEDTLKEFMNTYFCYLLLEKKEKKTWARVFKTYEDFMNSEDSELVTRGLYFLIVLIKNESF